MPGPAWMGVGQASDVEAGRCAASSSPKRLDSPLLDVDITGAQRALVNITGGPWHEDVQRPRDLEYRPEQDDGAVEHNPRNRSPGRTWVHNIRVIVIATGFPTDEEQRDDGYQDDREGDRESGRR